MSGRIVGVVGGVIGLLIAVGCGGGGTPSSVETQLDEVFASGAVMGGQGKLRLTFDNPLPSDTSVMLTSLAPAVATVSTKVTVKQGTLTATIPYTAVATGETQISATVGTTTLWGNVAVVDAIRVEEVGGGTAEAGTPGTFYVELNIVPPTQTDVTIAVANAAVATADAVVHVPEFGDNGQGSITYVAPGTTTITATLGTSTATGVITVVDHARLSAVQGAQTVEAGAMLTLYADLTAAVAASTPIMVTSSNPTVIAAPTLVVQEGSSAANAQDKALAAGNATLTYVLADSTLTQQIRVVTSGTLEQLSIGSVPAVGQATAVTVSLDATAVTAHDIALTSSDATIVSVPAKITVQPGQSSATIYVTPLKAGAAALTATYLGITRQALLQVGSVDDPQLPTLTLYQPAQLAVGSIGQLQVYAYGPSYTTGATATFTSSDPTIVAVPPTITLDSYSTEIPLTALKVGTVTITASAYGTVATTMITVVAQGGIVALGPNNSEVALAAGAQSLWNVQLSAQPPIGTPITLTSSAPSVASVPAVVYADGGSPIGFLVTGATVGTAIITATLGTDSVSNVVYVGTSVSGTAPSPSQLSSFNAYGNPLLVGASILATGTFSAYGPSVDTMVQITFSTDGVLKAPSTTVLVPAGAVYFQVPLTGAAVGSTTVTAASDGQMFTTGPIPVVASPTLSYNSVTSIKVGASAAVRIITSDVLPSDLVVTLTTGDASIITIPTATCTMATGVGGSCAVVVTAKAAGMVTLSATGGGSMPATLMMTVTP